MAGGDDDDAEPAGGRPLADEAYVAFAKWLRARGLGKHPISCAEFAETGRGAMATTRIEVGTCIARIPLALLITTEVACRAMGLRPLLESWGRRLTAVQMLCMFLVRERRLGPASEYAPYIAVLPETYDTPSYFSEEEMATLRPGVCERARAQRASVEEAHEEVVAFCESHPSVLGPAPTFAEFQWAWHAVNTRCVYMDVKAAIGFEAPVRGKDVCVLAPFLDMLNHASTAKITSGFNAESGAYEINTQDEYDRGDQVFICYGQHGNDALLMEYGFVLPSNPNSVVSYADAANSLLDTLRAQWTAAAQRTAPARGRTASRGRLYMQQLQSGTAGAGRGVPVVARVSEPAQSSALPPAVASSPSSEASALSRWLPDGELSDKRLATLDGVCDRRELACGPEGLSWAVSAWAVALTMPAALLPRAREVLDGSLPLDVASIKRAYTCIAFLTDQLISAGDHPKPPQGNTWRARMIGALWHERDGILGLVRAQCQAKLDNPAPTWPDFD